jgi:hypothetical protein
LRGQGRFVVIVRSRRVFVDHTTRFHRCTAPSPEFHALCQRGGDYSVRSGRESVSDRFERYGPRAALGDADSHARRPRLQLRRAAMRAPDAPGSAASDHSFRSSGGLGKRGDCMAP